MTVTRLSLERLDAHWAISAIPVAERVGAAGVAQARLVGRAVARQLHLPVGNSEPDDELIRRVALAYEMAAIEGLPAFRNQSPDQDGPRGQCAAGASRAFELRRLLPVPASNSERIFHVLHLASLAYCGDRWSDIRRWFAENPAAVSVPSVAEATW